MPRPAPSAPVQRVVGGGARPAARVPGPRSGAQPIVAAGELRGAARVRVQCVSSHFAALLFPLFFCFLPMLLIVCVCVCLLACAVALRSVASVCHGVQTCSCAPPTFTFAQAVP
jgi:hypothetical protein